MPTGWESGLPATSMGRKESSGLWMPVLIPWNMDPGWRSMGKVSEYNHQVVEKIIKQGIIVCRTIAGFERLPIEEATPEHSFWPDYEILRLMVQDGIKLAAGTNSGIDQTPISGYAYTLETMAGLGEMSRPAVIKSATRLAAEAVGLADQIGTLQKGKRADLIAVTGNPLEDLRVLRHIDYVIRDGKVIVQDGHVLG